ADHLERHGAVRAGVLRRARSRCGGCAVEHEPAGGAHLLPHALPRTAGDGFEVAATRIPVSEHTAPALARDYTMSRRRAMDFAAISQNAVNLITQVGLKLLGAVVIWIVGRALIKFGANLLGRTLSRQSVDATITHYIL